MGSFAESIGHLQPMFNEIVGRQELADFITSDERVAEAEAVEGCISRAVAGELDLTGRLAISRFRLSPFGAPGLAEYLGGFDSLAPDKRSSIAEAVRRVLGLGWLYVCSPEAHIVPNRTDHELWAAWAPSLNGVDLGQAIEEKRLAEKITNHGQKLLRSELKQLGGLGVRRRIKVGVIGIHLVTLGAFLRIAQTDEIAELNPPAPQTREGGEPGVWAWSQYPQAAQT